jgi:hypothetical protein
VKSEYIEQQYMLKIITIIFGLLVAVTRGLGVASPTKMKFMITKLTQNLLLMRLLGISVFVLAALIFIALGGNFSGARLVMLFFGIFSLLGAFVLLFWPQGYVQLVESFLALPDPLQRLLYGTGFALGIALVVLGVFYY